MTDALVFASRRSPFPLVNGARIRCHRLLTGLAEAFDTTLVTFEHHPGSPDGHCGRAELERLLPGIEVVTVPGLGPAKRLAQVRSLASRHSYVFGRYRRPAIRSAVLEAAARRRAAVVHFDDVGVAQFGPVPGTLSVFAAADVEHRITAATAESTAGVRSLMARIEAPKVRREEERVWQDFPLCLAVSELDAEAIERGGARRVEVCPNGTDPVERLPPPRRASGEALRILFVGSGRYGPYARGVAWFVREVLPRLRDATPATVDIVGESPPRPETGEGVRYLGTVPSVAPWYERAHVAVVPVFEGSGTRLKIVEAMAYGRPVLSTRLGAEGLPVQAGSHYLEADDAGGWVAALSRIAAGLQDGDPELQAMLDRARTAAEPFFWPAVVGRLVELYRHELQERPANLAGGPGAAD